jgi:ATP-dependent DNA helicase 2 subunit 2
MALSSFVHALHELSSVAVARLVVKSDKPPELILLAPVIEAEAEYLVDVSLPFAEDVRGYRFPPLDRVVLASGKSITVHRHLPDEKLQVAMDSYVEGMDLDNHAETIAEVGWDPSAFSESSETAYDAFTPIPHRIDAAIRHRATHPSSEIPPPYPILTKYSSPPSDLIATEQIKALIEAASVKKVPPQSTATRRQRNRETASTTVSGLDVQKLLAKRTPEPRVDPDNPIPSFRQMLDTTKDPDGIKNAAGQLGSIIEKRVTKDVGGREEDRVIEEMRTLRSEMIEMEEPGVWNKWARQFREKLLKGELGGERRELWWKVRGQGKEMGLIEEGRQGVSKEEAEGYWSLKV